MPLQVGIGPPAGGNVPVPCPVASTLPVGEHVSSAPRVPRSVLIMHFRFVFSSPLDRSDGINLPHRLICATEINQPRADSLQVVGDKRNSVAGIPLEIAVLIWFASVIGSRIVVVGDPALRPAPGLRPPRVDFFDIGASYHAGLICATEIQGRIPKYRAASSGVTSAL